MRPFGPGVAVALAALALSVSGCMAARARGQLGHASFVYEGCSADCDVIGNRLAAGGANAIIDVDLEPGFRLASVRSSNPGVATFTIGTSDAGLAIHAVSGAAGRTQLQLFDPVGQLIDEIGVGTAATAHLGYGAVSTYGGAVTLLQGGSQAFRVTTQDDSGKTTLGHGSVRFAVGGPLVPVDAHTLRPALDAASAASDALAFTATEPGAGLVHAFVDAGVGVTLPVDVVAATDLVAIVATVGPNSGDGSDVFANVDVVARTADTPVYGASCDWTVDAPATVEAQTLSALDSPARSTTRFRLPEPGAYLARCAVGSLTTSVVLRR
jgi:hypothetical protein